MACSEQPLVDFNVFASGDDLTLNRTCSELAQPFEQLCLVPPAPRLANTLTCKLQLQDIRNAQYLFPKITQGLVQTLEDLPMMYVSFPEQEDTDETWIRDSNNPNTILDFDAMQYTGFRPVSRPDRVLGLATSEVSSQVFLLLSNSATNDNVLQLFKANELGLFQTQVDDSGNVIQASYASSAFAVPEVACSADGLLQGATLSGIAYRFDAENNRWSQLGIQNARSLCISNTSMVVFTLNQAIFVSPTRAELSLNAFYVWQCLSLDRLRVFVCTAQNPLQATIYTIDLATRTIVQTANCVTSAHSLSTNEAYTALQNRDGALFVTNGSILMQFVLQGSIAIQSIVPGRSIARFYSNRVWFEDSRLHFADREETFATPQGMTSAMCMASASADVWSFVNGTLQRFPIAESKWTNEFDLFMSFDSRMNDENGAWHFPPSIDPPWYFGSISRNVDLRASQMEFPFFWNQSRHNRFRWIFDSITTQNNTQFSHLISHLERINDFMLLTTSSTAHICDDGNMVTELFESNTHDQAGNPSTFVSLDAVLKRPVSTANGVYLVYCNTQNNARQIVMCYNVFNSSLFADWCSEQTPEFLSRALQQQSEFCFQNLSFVSDDDGTDQFSDARCECVPSLPMFKRLFPDAFANVTSYTATRTIQNIPCLSQKCSDVFLQGQENTNVLNYATAQCKQDIIVCSNTLFVTQSLKAQKFHIMQDCGEDNRCAQNAQCPANSICFDGDCIQKCTTDDYCRQNLQDPLASCEFATGRCLYNVPETQPSNAKTYWIVAGAVFLVIVVILVIVMLALYTN